MPNWYWEKKDLRNTPSQNKGMDFDTGNSFSVQRNILAINPKYDKRLFLEYITCSVLAFLHLIVLNTPRNPKQFLVKFEVQDYSVNSIKRTKLLTFQGLFFLNIQYV